MKRTNRILLALGCIVLLAISWLLAITAESNEEKQMRLIEQANAYLEDEIYVLAEPLLTEAASYEDTYTLEAEEQLKSVYRQLLEQTGYSTKYEDILLKQMARSDASENVFLEAAEFYFERSLYSDAYTVLHDGISKTNSEKIREYYEDVRYKYSMYPSDYHEVTTAHQGTVQVCRGGKWGLAAENGDLIIPCMYDAISTFGGDRVVVKAGEEIFAVDSNNNRVALHHGDGKNIGGFADCRLAIEILDGWTLTNERLEQAPMSFEALGMYSNGYTAAKVNGKWGVVDTSGSLWIIEPTYDDVIRDELGRCFVQGRVFVRMGKQVSMLSGDGPVGEIYEDAQPFAEGWAAVKKNGKWGFVDSEGQMRIQPRFEDALSFGAELAAVKLNGKWGYVSTSGEVVIKPQFEEAKSFYNGSAPVKTENGSWQFITLVEYEE